MAPMKRPPTAMINEDEESEGEDRDSPQQKRGKLEGDKINNILSKIYR